MQHAKTKNAPGSTRAKTGNGQPNGVKDSSLMAFFIDQLEDMYWAEKKLVKTLPRLAEAAHSEELKEAIENHLIETKQHVTRLEKAFDLIDIDPKAEECPAIKGIIEEGERIIDQTRKATAQRDVGLIFAAQKAEHYEIATYGGLVQLARVMDYDGVADLLEDTLLEKKGTDQRLSEIAETGINADAAHEKG